VCQIEDRDGFALKGAPFEAAERMAVADRRCRGANAAFPVFPMVLAAAARSEQGIAAAAC
jgi:hypothetical protein